MSEENTRQLSGSRSFEERVFARFDAIDQRFERFEPRFEAIENRLEKFESRSYDTKPIWERALKAIMDTALEVGEIKKKVGVIETKVDTLEKKFDTLETKVETLEKKVDTIETSVGRIETRVDTIETRLGNVEGDLAAMRVDYAGLHDQLIESQRDFKVKITRRIDLVLETLVDTRDEMRNSDERLTRLESKLA